MEAATANIASRYLQRRVLLVSMMPLALLFALTVTLARTYHLREEGLVQEWSAQGNADMSSGRPANALEDYRNALSYDPGNDLIELRLAEALLAGGRLTEARSYLLNLWDRTPGSGEVNLDLAHISAQLGDVDQAIRYFRGAIYGSWEKQPADRRREARLELCKFLLGQNRGSDAQAEIAGLIADTPADDGNLHEKAAQFLLQVGQPAGALAEFEAALRSNPQESGWLQEAGKAAYAARNYSKAEVYLSQAARENPSQEILELLGTARDVQNSDPFLAGLSDNEQAQRSWRGFQQGLQRLQQCSGANPAASSGAQPSSNLQTTDSQTLNLQALNKDAQDLKRHVNLQSLGRNSQLRNQAMQLVFRIEETAAQTCGTLMEQDQALILIGERHADTNP
jgi:predicted Zn-dependent protease